MLVLNRPRLVSSITKERDSCRSKAHVSKELPFLALSAALAAPPVPATHTEALQTLLSGAYAHSAASFHAHAAVLNWNIDRGQRLDDIKDEIGRIKPDLCISQDVDLNARRTHGEEVAKDLAEAFGMNYVFAPEVRELGQAPLKIPSITGKRRSPPCQCALRA